MTSNTWSPNAATSFLAKPRPMPLIMPEARYASMPSVVLGGTTATARVRNWRPKFGSVCQLPSARTTSPGPTWAHSPTKVARSRWSASLTRSTQKPVAGLWNTTRSTRPDRRSVAGPGGLSAKGSTSAAWRSPCGMARRTWRGPPGLTSNQTHLRPVIERLRRFLASGGLCFHAFDGSAARQSCGCPGSSLIGARGSWLGSSPCFSSSVWR